MSEEYIMSYKEAIEKLETMKAEAEWEYPIDWQIALDTAIASCKWMKNNIKEVIKIEENKTYKSDSNKLSNIDNNYSLNISNRIMNKLIENGKTMKDFKEHFGYSNWDIGRLFTGNLMLPPKTLEEFAVYLNTTKKYFITGERSS